MPSPIKVVNLGISPATHIICKVTRISARCLIWVVRAVSIDEITPLFQVNTRTIWTLEARWWSWCGRGRWETWRWKKQVSQERFNKFICRKNLDFKKNIFSAPSSSFWVHIFGTIDRWLLVFIGRVSQSKKQVLNLTKSPTFDESLQATFIRRTTRHTSEHLANKFSCSTINWNGWSHTCPRKFTLLLQKRDKKSVKI